MTVNDGSNPLFGGNTSLADAGEQLNFTDMARERASFFGQHPGFGRLIDTGTSTGSAVTGIAAAPAARSGRAQPEPNPFLSDSFSARRTFSASQAVLLPLLSAGLAACLWLWPHGTTLAIGVFLTLVYLAIILFRAALLSEFRGSKNLPATDNYAVSEAPQKRYVILAALYHEASMVPELVAALDRLQWPAALKQVHLVCEADDAETIAAIRAIRLPARFHLFIAPPGRPRTKPRALNLCLAQCDGDYLVIYDAEDRPDPGQLLEAHRAFACGPETLACLQAPLAIDNRKTNWLTGMFALEYDTLFRGILPALAAWHAPMPLGGTSNHFKLPLLKAAGAWDAWNVTEDADLGMRLARMGYACSTITRPTFEEAPSRFTPWLKQRTRWLKGWMRTLLVHHRNPAQTLREMGARRFALFQLMLTGVVPSVLIHPVFLVTFAATLMDIAAGGHLSSTALALLGISTFNLVGGYSTYMVLAHAVANEMEPGRHKVFGIRLPARWRMILAFPVYWVLISLAGWRAA